MVKTYVVQCSVGGQFKEEKVEARGVRLVDNHLVLVNGAGADDVVAVYPPGAWYTVAEADKVDSQAR